MAFVPRRKKSAAPEVDPATFLAGLPTEVRGVVVALREMVRQTAPEAEETVLWGGLSYHRPRVGGRVKGAVCQIGAKRGQVRLDFIHGIWLNDPHGLLQGERRSKRFIPIATVNDARRPEVADLIRQAAALDWAQ
jgi:hypothetical protein